MAMAQKQSSRPGEEAKNIKAGHVTRQVHVQGFIWQWGTLYKASLLINSMALQGGYRATTHRQTAHSRLGGHVEQFLTDSKATPPRRNICDFFLFPKTNIQLKRRRHKDTADSSRIT